MTSKQKQTIAECWDQMRDAIDKAYKTGNIPVEHTAALRDYARDISWSDDLEKLLDREIANERQHRSTRTIRGFSCLFAARLIVMNNVARGTFAAEMPSALTFITWRPEAAEAHLLGYLIRHAISADWCQTVDSMSYSDMMEKASA